MPTISQASGAKESHAVAGDLSWVLKAIVTDTGLYMQIEKISMEGDYDAGNSSPVRREKMSNHTSGS